MSEQMWYVIAWTIIVFAAIGFSACVMFVYESIKSAIRNRGRKDKWQ